MSNPARRHKHIRLAGYDYSQPNAYVFTVVTKDRQCGLGSVVDLEFRALPAGEIVRGTWNRLPEKFPTILLDAFIVMPNHIHGIVFLGANPDIPSEVAINVDATNSVSSQSSRPHHSQNPVTNTVASTFMATFPHSQSSKSGSQSQNCKPLTPLSHDPLTPDLGEIIRSLKAASSTQIRKKFNSTFAWQPNYWERIIRNDAELERYRAHIENNPALWEKDPEYLMGDW
jgi:REP-associated tyrosine transposase